MVLSVGSPAGSMTQKMRGPASLAGGVLERGRGGRALARQRLAPPSRRGRRRRSRARPSSGGARCWRPSGRGRSWRDASASLLELEPARRRISARDEGGDAAAARFQVDAQHPPAALRPARPCRRAPARSGRCRSCALRPGIARSGCGVAGDGQEHAARRGRPCRPGPVEWRKRGPKPATVAHLVRVAHRGAHLRDRRRRSRRRARYRRGSPRSRPASARRSAP